MGYHQNILYVGERSRQRLDDQSGRTVRIDVVHVHDVIFTVGSWQNELHVLIANNEVAVDLNEAAQVIALHLRQADVIDHQALVLAGFIQVMDVDNFLYGFAVEDAFRGARLLVRFVVELGVDGFSVLHFPFPW
jgi:hypothetical protein